MCAKQAAWCSAQPRAQHISRCNELVISVIYQGAYHCSPGIHPLSQAALSRFYSVISSLGVISRPVVFAGALLFISQLHFLQPQSARDAVLLLV